jgi:hypothetical protein
MLTLIKNQTKVYILTSNFNFFFYYCSLNSGSDTCQASTVPLEPHIQSLALVCFSGSISHFCLGPIFDCDLLTSFSRVAGIKGMYTTPTSQTSIFRYASCLKLSAKEVELLLPEK